MEQSLADMAGSMPSQQGALPVGWNFLFDPISAFGAGMKPLSLNLERAYGGLAGSLPSRPRRAAIRIADRGTQTLVNLRRPMRTQRTPPRVVHAPRGISRSA